MKPDCNKTLIKNKWSRIILKTNKIEMQSSLTLFSSFKRRQKNYRVA